eukprot:5909828-Prorocentrum_lima.AAC.1
MTSSLVGSEMCIRDRFLPSEDHVLAASLSYLSLPALPWGQQVSVASISVSYTHLTLPTICSV